MENNQTQQPQPANQIQPHKVLHRWLPTIIGVAIVVFVGGGALAYQAWWSGPSEPEIQESKTETTPAEFPKAGERLTEDETADWKTYRNEEFGFEVKYPESSRINGNRIDLSFASGTTLSEKYLVINTKKSIAAECSNPMNTMIRETELVSIDSIEFKKEVGGEGAAGSIYDSVSYSTQKDNQCIGLSFVLRSGSPGAYDPDLRPEVFDREEESKIFDQILSTFRFIDQDDETVGWTTYESKNFGFEFKYPPTWEIEYFADYNTERDVFVFTTHRSEIEKYPSLTIKRNWSAQEEIDRINSEDSPYAKVHSTKDIILGSFDAKEIVYSSTLNINFQKTIIGKDTTMFVFDALPADEEFEQVISSLKFLN